MRRPCVVALILLTALGIEHAAAQSGPAETADRADRAEPIEEIMVLGQRTLRSLRLEVQAARERVYDLFNSLNSDDEFNIHCRHVPRTGTRVLQRVCRPQYADSATSQAGREFADELFRCGGLSEACLERGASLAQGVVSVVPLKDQQLAAELQRLTRESIAFRRAIAEYQAVERRYENARRAEGPELLASVSIIGSGVAPRPSRRAALRDAIVAPRPIELVTPDVLWSGPGTAALREGWVKLRYSVLADGTASDVRAVDAMPAGLDPSGAVDAARTWTFEPATADGAPIDWHNNLAVIAFNREQALTGGSPAFAEAYEEVAGLIAGARFEEAKSRGERMQRELAHTLDEAGLAQMQLAAIEHALGDPHAALDAIRRATQTEIPQLADEELTLALEHRFALEVQLGRAADALDTYERRVALARLPSRDPLARQGAALREALAAPQAGLAVQGRIDGNGQWEYPLTWATFAVGDVDGQSESLAVECHRNKAALPFELDVEVTIPAAWGECVLFVRGQPDTTFTLYEFSEPIGQ
jgi:tetratricopeptide (TPR) repeat protein